MTSILSSISGYFSKSLILGTVLPVAIFIVFATLFLAPLLPSDLAVFAFLEGIDKQWRVLAVSFVAVVASGLIYNLNIPILRVYEGYPWKDSWLGKRLTRRHQAKFDTAQYRIEAMRIVLRLMTATRQKVSSQEAFTKAVLENLKALGAGRGEPIFARPRWLKVWETWPRTDRLGDIKEQWQEIDSDLDDSFSAYRRQIKHNYPDKRGLILPTRLGNVIRSFEYYSDREYQIDSIELWPRLVAVIPEAYAVSIDDAKTSFDFMMNCSALSLLLGFLILLAGLVFPAQLASSAPLLYWAIKIAGFTMLSYFFYRLSINRAGAWGSLVKGSFDLFRWELLKKLGYKQEPETREAERKLWYEISRQMIYGDRFDKKLQAYVENPEPQYPSVCSEPAWARLEITRGVRTRRTTDVVTLFLRIENTDPNFAEANVVVTDKLADDFDYQWGSAKVEDVHVPVTGTNPYSFKIGNLLKAKEALLTYNAVPRKTRTS